MTQWFENWLVVVNGGHSIDYSAVLNRLVQGYQYSWRWMSNTIVHKLMHLHCLSLELFVIIGFNQVQFEITLHLYSNFEKRFSWMWKKWLQERSSVASSRQIFSHLCFYVNNTVVKQQVQFQLFEKLASANWFQIELENIIMITYTQFWLQNSSWLIISCHDIIGLQNFSLSFHQS